MSDISFAGLLTAAIGMGFLLLAGLLLVIALLWAVIRRPFLKSLFGGSAAPLFYTSVTMAFLGLGSWFLVESFGSLDWLTQLDRWWWLQILIVLAVSTACYGLVRRGIKAKASGG